MRRTKQATVGMQRSSSQRQVKKVNVPLVPDIPGMQQAIIPAAASGASSTSSSASCTSSSGGGGGGPQHFLHSTTKNFVTLSSNNANANNNNNILISNSTGGGGGSLSRRATAYGNFSSAANSITPSGNNQQMQQNDKNSSGTIRSQGSSASSASPHPQAYHHHQLLMTGSSPHQQQVNGNSVLLSNGASPARHRNSTGSNSSQTSSGFESMKSGIGQPYVNVTVHQLRGDSPPSRNSVHSSGSSSLGSLERLDESGYGSSGHVNVAEMLANGVPDEEILAPWLHNLHHEEYLPLFTNAGYDLPSVSRMTPEDLTAIGITKPGHRKRLTTEIHKLNVPEQWPANKPAALREWLCLLKLPEYVPVFESQGFRDVDQLAQLTWEDYEDFGVKKLGHLKKLVLASKKLKDYSHYQQQQRHLASKKTSQGSLPSRDTTSELLVINVPPCPVGGLMAAAGNYHHHHQSAGGNRNTAEVRPYSHLPAEMSTFHHQQGSPRHHIHQGCGGGLNDYRPPSYCSPSPTHRSCNGNMQHIPANRSSPSFVDQQHSFQNPNVVTTEAVLHDRPKVTVKPILSVTGSSNRGSRERLVEDDYKAMACSSSNRSPLIHSPRHHPRLVNHDSTNDSGEYGGYLNTTNGRLQQDGIMCRSAPSPTPQGSAGHGKAQAAPQKPPIGPLARPGAVFQLSAANSPPPQAAQPPPTLPKLTRVIDEASCCSTSSMDELSPAPSMDEFPPPPSPILCMESIKNLRNVREHNPHFATTVAMTTTDDDDDNELKISNSAASTGTLTRRRESQQQKSLVSSAGLSITGQAVTTTTTTMSTTSIESNSSTETLPFANENVGTIRQKYGNQQQVHSADNGNADNDGSISNNTTMIRKPHVNQVFGVNGGRSAVDQGPCNNSNAAPKPANVLNDIGFMLQDLTDQLIGRFAKGAQTTTTAAIAKVTQLFVVFPPTDRSRPSRGFL